MSKPILKSTIAYGQVLVLLAALVLSLWACERDTVSTEIVGIQPAQGAEVTPGTLQFKWVSNGYGDFRFRLGTADMQVILLDTVLSASQLTITPSLVRGAGYRWEVQQGGAQLAREFATADIATLSMVQPVPADSMPLTGNTFAWNHYTQGPFRFRLGDPGMVNVLVDTTISGRSYTPSYRLDPGVRYQCEVSVNGEVASAQFTSISIQQLAVGDHPGTWHRRVYNDPNSTSTTGTGILRVLPTGAGYTVDVLTGSSWPNPVYVQATHVIQGVQYCTDTLGDTNHNFTKFQYDFVHNTCSLFSRYGPGNASFVEMEFDSN